jgi:DNA-binding response OmpR family regulator
MSKAKNQCRIFVVDDEVTIATTLGAILRRQGFEVSCFTDPHKVLEAMHSQAAHLLIADVVMPELSGIDLAIVVRETWPDCTVILFSGQPSTGQLIQAARDRGHDFEVLTKPVPPREMLARVFSGLGLGLDADGPTGT